MTESNAAQSSIPSLNTTPSTNKDLSCLRCRKKKAKCSKTRPTCTRCLRSNQSCEYPDAPPNLSDLSQKVLTLYDSLRELEGEFLVKYMQNMEQDPEPVSDIEEETVELQKDITIGEPAGWSMSFGPSGLCLQAVTRNFYEYHKFIISLSQQLARDFGQDFLPKRWDPDAEGYGEEIEQDELDEDEYLVTIPVVSIHTLFSTDLPTNERTSSILSNFVNMHQEHMIGHLESRYRHLGEGQHHLVMIMLQLKPFLPPYTSSTLSELCTTIAYVVSICLLPPIPQCIAPPLPAFVWQACVSQLSSRLANLVFTQDDELTSRPVILCILLLAWCQIEINNTKNDTWIELALRISYRKSITGVMPVLIYLDTYSALFQARKSIFLHEEEEINTGDQDVTKPHLGIILEARLMRLLHQVLSLFYQVEHTRQEEEYRKIDIDEVLNLVKQVELWEDELPEWAKWNSKEEDQASLKMHMHMIYNIIKILLFRPFTRMSDEQTYTKTTFLDMSMISADRLSVCLHYNQHETNWIKTSKNLIKDVVARLKTTFDQDEYITEQIDLILNKI